MIMWFWLIEQNAVNVFVTDLGHTKKSGFSTQIKSTTTFVTLIDFFALVD